MNWDKIKDILTICLIPAVGWVMITSRDIGQMQQRIEQQAADIVEAQAEIKSLSKRAQMIEVQTAKIETKLEVMSGQLTRIEQMMNTAYGQIK
jgi:septal ring factor EnvC (AmiA/AmiB activator)